MVSCLTFGVYGVREWSNFMFILYIYIYPFFPTSLIEETVFIPLYILASFLIDWLTIQARIYKVNLTWIIFLGSLSSIPLSYKTVFIIVV